MIEQNGSTETMRHLPPEEKVRQIAIPYNPTGGRNGKWKTTKTAPSAGPQPGSGHVHSAAEPQ